MSRPRRPARRWIPPAPVAERDVDELATGLSVPPAVCRILLRRGLSRRDDVGRFLRPRLEDLHDPAALPDLPAAVERVEASLRRGETILVHGDYDADGMSAAALLYRALHRLGARVEAFVPHRTRDGYDLSEAGLRRAARIGAGLVVTADCGVTAVEAVARAARSGRDVVVTDHHRPGPRLPAAAAVVDPMREGNAYPFDGLAGVGVAFKLVQALFARAGVPQPELFQHLDLVAIGTVADQMPLVGENRVLVRAGLRALARTRKPGLRALLDRVGLAEEAEIEAEHVAFRIGPRLNSVGRMAAADAGLRLLLTEDPREAERLAQHLDRQNAERRAADRRVYAEVERMLDRAYDAERDRALVLWGDDWHPGVIGIVASRVVEKIHRPTVVVAFDGETGRGSGRSIQGFHLFQALQELSPLLDRFGGHRMAAGLSIRRDRIEEFAGGLRALAARQLDDEDLVEDLRLDLVLPLAEAGDALLSWLRRLAPFGSGNPAPVLMAPAVRFEAPTVVGSGGAHLRTTLADDGARLEGIAFGAGARIGEMAAGRPWDVAFELGENRWNGRRRIQARILDFRPTP